MLLVVHVNPQHSLLTSPLHLSLCSVLNRSSVKWATSLLSKYLKPLQALPWFLSFAPLHNLPSIRTTVYHFVYIVLVNIHNTLFLQRDFVLITGSATAHHAGKSLSNPRQWEATTGTNAKQ